MTTWTKEGRKGYDRDRHKRLYAEKSRRQEKRRKEIRQWLLDLKGEMKCSKCPESHVACLQFHHLRDKTESIANMVKGGFGKKRILEEIDKCVIICGNCHAKEHFNER